MDLRFTPEEIAFRKEVQEFLASYLRPDLRVQRSSDGAESDEAIRREWQSVLYQHGWLKLSWPTELGGRSATPIMQAIFQEELTRAGAPPLLGVLGVTLLVPVLMAFGSEWQKAQYVDRILSGDLVFCQGFSEPGAGSDLAGLRTAARHSENGHWIINGQKVWSSGGRYSQRSFLLARTDSSVAPHKGLGLFLVDLDQPGIEVRDIRQITGGSEFSEIFLSDARVEDRDLVGAPGDGWQLAMSTFGHERGGLASAARFEAAAEELRALAVQHGLYADTATRQRVAQAYIEARTFTALSMRALTRAEKGQAPGPEASLIKLYWSEMDKRLREMGVGFQGMYGALTPEDSPDDGGPWRHAWLWSLAETIYAGTSEIQRNIIAERVLGLPRNR